MRRILMSLTLASTVAVTGCPWPGADVPGEIDLQAVSENQAANQAAIREAVDQISQGQVDNAISGKIEIPVDLKAIAAELEPGAPLVQLHAFRSTGEVLRDAQVTLMSSDARTYAFVVDNVPAGEPIVLAATIEPGVVLRTVVPPASRQEPARAQVINTQSEIVTQELAKLGIMPHVGTFGIGSVLAQGGLDPAAAAAAYERAAAAMEEFANSELGKSIPEAGELVGELRDLAQDKREIAQQIAANNGVLPPTAGTGNYAVANWFPCLWNCEPKSKIKRLVDKAKEKAPDDPVIDSVFTSEEFLRQGSQTDAPKPAPPPASKSTGGGNVIFTSSEGLQLRMTSVGTIYGAVSGKLIGQAGGNLKGHLGGDLWVTSDGSLYVNGQLFGDVRGRIIATGGGNIIATGGLNIIATGGGNIISTGGVNLAKGGANIISTGGGNFLADQNGALYALRDSFDAKDSGRLIGQAGGNLNSTGGGNYRVSSSNGGRLEIIGNGRVYQNERELTTANDLISKKKTDTGRPEVQKPIPPKPPMRDRLDAFKDALAKETQKKVSLNGIPFDASEIRYFLDSGKNPYRTECSQIRFDSSNTSCRTVVSPKGVQEVLVTRRAQTLDAYVAQLKKAWDSNDSGTLDRLFKENPALINFVDHPHNAAWKSPIGTWRMRVVQLRGNDNLGPEFVLVRDAEVKLEYEEISPTQVLPDGPVAAALATWFSYGAPTDTIDVLNEYAMKFIWQQGGLLLKDGVISGEDRMYDNRSRKLYNATFSGKMNSMTLLEGEWQSSDNATGGVFQMIRGSQKYTIPSSEK